MSEETNSEKSFLRALELEKTITNTLEDEKAPAARARKEVRVNVEELLGLLNDPKIAQEYSEQIGGVPVSMVQNEVLGQIANKFAGVAKDYGWDPKASAEQHFEQAA